MQIEEVARVAARRKAHDGANSWAAYFLRCSAAVAQIQRHGSSKETDGGGLIPQCSWGGVVDDPE